MLQGGGGTYLSLVNDNTSKPGSFDETEGKWVPLVDMCKNINSLIDRTSSLEQRANNIEDRLNKIDVSLTNIVSDYTQQINGLVNQIGLGNSSLQNQINKLSEVDGSLQNQINSLGQTTGSLQNQINSLGQTDSSLQNQINTVSGVANDALKKAQDATQNSMSAKWSDKLYLQLTWLYYRMWVNSANTGINQINAKWDGTYIDYWYDFEIGGIYSNPNYTHPPGKWNPK